MTVNGTDTPTEDTTPDPTAGLAESKLAEIVEQIEAKNTELANLDVEIDVKTEELSGLLSELDSHKTDLATMQTVMNETDMQLRRRVQRMKLGEQMAPEEKFVEDNEDDDEDETPKPPKLCIAGR